MQPSPARTRTHMLRERLGVEQDGSTRVRSTGRLAEEHNPVHRPAGVEENEEDNHPEELKSEIIIANDDLSDNYYDYDYGNNADKTPVSVGRSIGDDGFQTYKSEQPGYPSMSPIYPDTFRKSTSPHDCPRPSRLRMWRLRSIRRGESSLRFPALVAKRRQLKLNQRWSEAPPRRSSDSSLWHANFCPS